MQKIFVNPRIRQTPFSHNRLHLRNRFRIQYINLHQRFYPTRPRTIYLSHRYTLPTSKCRYHPFQVQHYIRTGHGSTPHPAPCLLSRVPLPEYNHITSENTMHLSTHTPSMMLNRRHTIAIRDTLMFRMLRQPLIMHQSTLMKHLL